jgi:hypothetical protein
LAALVFDEEESVAPTETGITMGADNTKHMMRAVRRIRSGPDYLNILNILNLRCDPSLALNLNLPAEQFTHRPLFSFDNIAIAGISVR